MSAAVYFCCFGSTDNIVGGENTGEGNVISGNGQYGVYFQGNPELQVNNNIVQGNYIGVDATGTTPVPNSVGVFGSGLTIIQIL